MSEPTPTPPAPAGTPPPVPAAPPPAAAAPPPPADWTSGLSDIQKGFAQNKGFKGPQDVVESYQNLEKLMGAPRERLITLPENLETPEGRAVFERLGTPKEAKGYDFKVPEKGGDPKLAEWAAQKFFEAGVPKNMADKIMSAWNERAEATKTQAAESLKAAQATADMALRQEWGMAYDKNKNLVDQAARVAGMGTEEVTALTTGLGPEKAAKLLLKIGQSVSESAFISGGPSGDSSLAPEQARSKIEELTSDKAWVQRYLSGDMTAKREMERLQKMKTGGQMASL